MSNSNIIAFHREYVELTGSITAALMLSQAVYWTQKTDDGWFYKSQTDWASETGMTRREQDGARKRLKQHGWWAEDRHGPRGTVRFRVDIELLDTAIQNGENVQPESIRMAECANLNESECTNGAIQNGENVQPPYTETTTKKAAARAPAPAHTREAEKPAAAATAQKPSLRSDPFILEYERIWGMLVESPYVAEEIQEWRERVTAEGWSYALKQAFDANARNWRYLRPILNRIERDGLPVNGHSAPTSQQATVELSWKELTQ